MRIPLWVVFLFLAACSDPIGLSVKREIVVRELPADFAQKYIDEQQKCEQEIQEFDYFTELNAIIEPYWAEITSTIVIDQEKTIAIQIDGVEQDEWIDGGPGYLDLSTEELTFAHRWSNTENEVRLNDENESGFHLVDVVNDGVRTQYSCSAHTRKAGAESLVSLDLRHEAATPLTDDLINLGISDPTNTTVSILLEDIFSEYQRDDGSYLIVSCSVTHVPPNTIVSTCAYYTSPHRVSTQIVPGPQNRPSMLDFRDFVSGRSKELVELVSR